MSSLTITAKNEDPCTCKWYTGGSMQMCPQCAELEKQCYCEDINYISDEDRKYVVSWSNPDGREYLLCEPCKAKRERRATAEALQKKRREMAEALRK